ncbi:hypothetical protein GCM10023192_01530 [Amycolatopsis samaneae]
MSVAGGLAWGERGAEGRFQCVGRAEGRFQCAERTEGVLQHTGGLACGAGTLGFLLPSPNGSGANFVTGLMNNPAGAITGTPDSIPPYGLLDGDKPQPLPSK